jgi:rRNA maturation protein Nop10
MTIIRNNGVEYKVFNDSDAYTVTYDPETEEPIYTLKTSVPAGTLLSGCPACGIDLKKPRPVTFWPDGSPKCIMSK